MKLVARRGGPLTGSVTVPGDKSSSHRALIFGAMADGETIIEGLLESLDTMATVAGLRALGADLEQLGPGQWRVRGGPWRSPEQAIDCGNSGTAARLLTGAVAGMEGVCVTFTGDASLSARPMRRITAPLKRMGAKIDGDERLPLTVTGAALGGIEHVNDPPSAQVKTALVLAGLSTDAPVRLLEPLPSRDHGEIMLGEMGVEVQVEAREHGWAVQLGARRTLQGTNLAIGADPSSAAFPLLGAAIIPGSRVRAAGVNVNPLRTGLFETLEAMGANLALSGEGLQSGEVVADIEVAHARLSPCEVTGVQIPAMIDEIPALAVACAFADGESVIHGLAELRIKESDRLGAVVAGLVACGVTAMARGDALHIFGRGNVRGGGTVVTHGDHRIAMAFLTLGLGAERPVKVDQAEMIETSFPGFVEAMCGLGADISEAP